MMRRRRPTIRHVSSAVLVAAAFLASPVASAQAPDAADLKKQGDAAFDGLRYADALALYERSYRASRDPAVLYNEARALQALGDFPRALDMLDRFAKEAPPDLASRVPKLAELRADLRAHVATVIVESAPRDAHVIVGDRDVTPGDETRLPAAASVHVHAERRGYADADFDVPLPGDAETPIAITLRRLETIPILRVETGIASSRIAVDGARRGTGAVEVELPAGRHRVDVTADDREPWESTVVLAPSDVRTVRVDLAPRAGIASRWWFWTGVAVVVAGAATLIVVVAASPASPPSGTLSPGRIKAEGLGFAF